MKYKILIYIRLTIKIAKMTTIYHSYRVNLTAGQTETVAKAMKQNTNNSKIDI